MLNVSSAPAVGVRPLVAAASESSLDKKLKLLVRYREALRVRCYSHRTEQSYVAWVKRYIFHHGIRHPEQMGDSEINTFLTHLAAKEKVTTTWKQR